MITSAPIEKQPQLAAAAAEASLLPALYGLEQAQLEQQLVASGMQPFRAKQLWGWLYSTGAADFTAMTSLGKPQQAQLQQQYRIGRLKVTSHQRSSDGTQKWLFAGDDGKEAETVFIPDAPRGTICISSQVGCTLNCRFCHTGTQPWVRNLTPAEIVGQLILVRDALGEWSRPAGGGRELTNIVLMGMGEPLYNYDNLAAAMRIAMHPDGLAFSRRRITLSTSGVVPAIERAGRELGVNLAISLHAVSNDVRDVIVPLNRKYPIEELLAACRSYPGLSNARRITFEYVMLKDVNDSDIDAQQLVRLLKGIPAKVNLIPFNPWPGAPYECSSGNRIHAFKNIVYEAGLSAPVRKPRGRDILAACGQLKSESERQRKSRH